MKYATHLPFMFVLASMFAACGPEEDPNALRGHERLGPRVNHALLASSLERDRSDAVDVVVADLDDAVMTSLDEISSASMFADVFKPTILYLNGNGATVDPGPNNSAVLTSNIVSERTTFPSSNYRRDAARWARIVDTVRRHFSRYNVVVVDEKPSSGPYLEGIITSGLPALINYGDDLSGIAPSRCGVIRSAVLFVFERLLRDEIHVAEVASHEFGHSLSLSHTQDLSDLMSYTEQTPLSFQDRLTWCGPEPGRGEPCNCGGLNQNNHRQLLRFVGTTTSSVAGVAERKLPSANGIAPIVLPSDGSTYEPGQIIDVRVDRSKVPAGSTVALLWQIGQRSYEFSCPSSSCVVEDDAYVWRIRAGSGERIFHTQVTTPNNNVYASPSVRIRSGKSAPTFEKPDESVSNACVAEINRYRATRGLPPLAQWKTAEVCTAQQCFHDAQSRTAHGTFGACGELAQNECPGWFGWKGDPKDVTSKCLEAMWAEGPSGGHYRNMTNPRYREVACSYHTADDGSVTVIQNFR